MAKQERSATLVSDRLLDPDDWYALVFETAETLSKGLAMSGYESLHYAARWLRGERAEDTLRANAQ